MHKQIKNFPIEEQNDVDRLFLMAIGLRKLHPELQEDIARAVFDRTHASQMPIDLTERQARIREEFGALEAPGSALNPLHTQVNFEQSLWRRLEAMISNA